jgi:hypothetical protein
MKHKATPNKFRDKRTTYDGTCGTYIVMQALAMSMPPDGGKTSKGQDTP